MAKTKTNSVPTFEHGDAFRIVLEVSDSSVVSRVETRFRNESEESVRSIYRSVDLDGEPSAEVAIEVQVDEDLPAGHYVCEYVALTDTKGNQSVFATPGIEFRVEGGNEDQQGPALLNWSFA
ncbi:MAG: hypothetical protein H0V53_00720 [Rubrobacter sp.]|nr:hypothetical protein [Rubrobacter sp.]